MRSLTSFLVTFLVAACVAEPTVEVIFEHGSFAQNRQPIINGVPAGDHPEHAAVVGLHQLTKRKGGSVYIYPFCTGTLIESDIVLTAAHCLDKAEDMSPTTPMKANELAIYVGDAPAADDGTGNPDILNGMHFVSEVLIHPDYNKFSITDDIGLVRLQSPVSGANPVGALSAADGFTAADEGVLSMNLVGFGQDENGDSGVKLQADVTLQTVLSTTEIDHAYTTGGICFGDSGGPAFVSRDGITSTVGGIASYVTSPYCQNTGAHTRADAFETFIADFINPPSEPPPPPGPTCSPAKAACDSGADCCSGNCKRGECKGN